MDPTTGLSLFPVFTKANPIILCISATTEGKRRFQLSTPPHLQKKLLLSSVIDLYILTGALSLSPSLQIPPPSDN
jgi:hypothetical protein